MRLVESALGDCNEYSNSDGRDDKRTDDRLQEDCVLDLTQSRLLDPHLAVEDFADDVTFLVFGHPGFVFIAVATSKGVETAFAELEIG